MSSGCLSALALLSLTHGMISSSLTSSRGFWPPPTFCLCKPDVKKGCIWMQYVRNDVNHEEVCGHYCRQKLSVEFDGSAHHFLLPINPACHSRTFMVIGMRALTGATIAHRDPLFPPNPAPSGPPESRRHSYPLFKALNALSRP